MGLEVLCTTRCTPNYRSNFPVWLFNSANCTAVGRGLRGLAPSSDQGPPYRVAKGVCVRGKASAGCDGCQDIWHLITVRRSGGRANESHPVPIVIVGERAIVSCLAYAALKQACTSHESDGIIVCVIRACFGERPCLRLRASLRQRPLLQTYERCTPRAAEIDERA